MNFESGYMIAGLGNPGRKYAKTRHNLGFMVIDRLAEKFQVDVGQNRFDNRFGTGTIEGIKVILTKPEAYMNRSGPPIAQLARYFKLNQDRILVIHDDIDIHSGQIKIKMKGGHGGHNGLKSIIDALGSGDFPRIRLGVGRPPAEMDAADYVLGKISAQEKAVTEEVLNTAVDAAVIILTHGIRTGMNRFN